jgi:hypothetical protein
VVAIVLWWGLLLGVACMLWPAAELPRSGLFAGALLAGFLCLTALSTLWVTNEETAFEEVNRVATYLGAFVLAVLLGTRLNVTRLMDGLALGIVAVALLALAARLFPDWIDASRPEGLFVGDPRPSWPIGYWNGLAVFTAMSVPLLMRAAVAAPGRAWRGLAVAPVPALAALIYLTSSRSGVVTAAVAVVAFIALTSERPRALVATAVAGIGSVVAVVVLAGQSAIADEPYFSPDATDEGRLAALAILAVCVVVGFAYAYLSTRELRWLSVPRPSRRGKVALAVTAGALLVAGVALADPAEKFDEFKEPPKELGTVDQSHLTSTGSSGRWQLWSAAVDEWREDPVVGGGAGSYEAWWAEHADIDYVARSAHSVYLDALAELGPLGLLLLLALLGVAAAAAWRRRAAAHGDEVSTVAAVAAVAAAFAVAIGVDWTWDLTVLPIVGLFVFGLLTGPATAYGERGRTAGLPWRIGFGVCALAIIAAQVIPLMAQTNIDDSRDAAARADTEEALDDAEAARGWQPWAASPYLQIALVHEQNADFEDARHAIEQAIDRSDNDWRLWLAASRIQSEAGDADAAEASYDRARELNPRSDLVASQQPPG